MFQHFHKIFSKILFLFFSTLLFLALTTLQALGETTTYPSGNGAVLDSEGVIFPITENLKYGKIVTTPCANEIVHNGITHLDQVDVVLDAGHGGPETGAVGANGLVERDLNLVIALLTEKELKKLGYSVALTRRTDLHMSIRQRTTIANALSPRAFVSIHHNGGAVRRSETPGTETFYQIGSSESKRLAGLLFEEISEALTDYWVPWVATVHQGASSRLKAKNVDAYGILRYTPDIPAVISEAVYLSNPPEAELMALPEVQIKEAQALARGIDRFLTSNDPGSGFKSPFIDGVMTGTGTGKGCVDPEYGTITKVAVGYSVEEYLSLVAAARQQKMTVEELQVFGVHALELFRLNAKPTSTSSEKINPPEVSGVMVEIANWSPSEQVALYRIANAYDMTPAEAQKLGAIVMVFLTGLMNQ